MDAFVFFTVVVTISSKFSLVNSLEPEKNCPDDKCYKAAWTSDLKLKDLTNRLNQTVLETKFYDTDDLDEKIRELKMKTNEVQKNLTKSEAAINENKQLVDGENKKVDLMREQLLILTEYQISVGRILKNASENQELMMEAFKIAEKAAAQCKLAHSKYQQFKKIIDSIVKDYNNIKLDYEEMTETYKKINQKILSNFDRTINNKNMLDNLSIPSKVTDNYFIKSQDEIDRIISYLKDNFELLKTLLRDLQQQWIREVTQQFQVVEKTVADLLKHSKSLEGDLNLYEKELTKILNFELSVDEAAQNLLNGIAKMYEEADRDFKSIAATIEFDKITLAIQKAKNYEMILNYYLTFLEEIVRIQEATKIKEIQNEIKNLKATIELIEQRDGLKKEFKHFKENAKAIDQIDCFAVRNPGLYQR